MKIHYLPFLVALWISLSAPAFAQTTPSLGVCDAFERFPLDDNPTVRNPVKIDLLWVMDDSSSMTPHQKALKDSLRSLFETLTAETVAVDYQMAITTTSGRIVTGRDQGALLLRSDSSVHQRAHFQKSLLVGTKGSSQEAGTQSALAFFEQNPSFLRAGSNAIVVILTDEDDSSDTEITPDTKVLKEAVRASGGNLKAFVLGNTRKLARYRENLKHWNPEILSLSESFETHLRNIGTQAIRSTNQKFSLERAPRKVLSASLTGPEGRTIPLREGFEFRIEDREFILSVDFPLSNSTLQITYSYPCSARSRDHDRELEAKRRELNRKLEQIDFIDNTDLFVNESLARRIIQEIANLLEENPELEILLVAATSSTVNPIGYVTRYGTRTGNDNYPGQDYGNHAAAIHRLAQARAEKVKDTLLEFGADSRRISTRGCWPGFGRHWYSYALDAVTAPYLLLYSYWPPLILIDFLIGFNDRAAHLIKKDRRVFIRFR